MFEIEGKFRLDNPGRVEELLRQLGAEPVYRGEETDIYYNYADGGCGDLAAADEALRIRLSSAGAAELTYKGPRKAGRYKRRLELTVHVDRPDELAEILRRLGFAEVAVVRKKRATYRLGDALVSLDSVEGLGTFLEIECARGEACIEEAVRLLGLSSEPLRETYLEMILEAPRR